MTGRGEKKRKIVRKRVRSTGETVCGMKDGIQKKFKKRGGRREKGKAAQSSARWL